MTIIPSIPVVMYHSVGKILPNWIWANMTIDVGMFEKQIQLLKKNNYESTDLDEYRSLREQGLAPDKRKIILTFDDGYLDNWVFVFPLLKREGWRGTIYVNPEFIDPGETPRLNLEDVWAGRCSMSDLSAHGFLNRAEIHLLQKSGVMEIASHSMSHTWHATSPDVIDFHRPGLVTPWLAWNKKPERKHAYLTEDQSQFESYGYPIHENGRSLGIRRHIFHRELAAASVEHVQANGGGDFFQKDQWEEELREIIAPWLNQGRLETDEEMTERFSYEIVQSKKILEDITGHKVKHFCWPGGAYNDDSWVHAAAAGFSTITVSRRDKKRWDSDDPSLVHRISCGSNFSFRGARYYTEDPSFLLTSCEAALGRPSNKWKIRLWKLVMAARTGFSPFKRSQ